MRLYLIESRGGQMQVARLALASPNGRNQVKKKYIEVQEVEVEEEGEGEEEQPLVVRSRPQVAYSTPAQAALSWGFTFFLFPLQLTFFYRSRTQTMTDCVPSFIIWSRRAAAPKTSRERSDVSITLALKYPSQYLRCTNKTTTRTKTIG